MTHFCVFRHVNLNGLEAIYRDGEVVGHVRRGEYAFALGKSMAVGYIKHPAGESVSLDFLKAGKYEIERMGTCYPATLHTKSPFDPKNKRVKGIYDEPIPIDQ